MKLLPFGLLLGRGERLVQEPELFASHYPSPGEGLRHHWLAASRKVRGPALSMSLIW